MTQKDKIEQKIMSNPIKMDITYTEVKNYLIMKGFKVTPGKGDHVKFTHNSLTEHLSIPSNSKNVKPAYIKMIQKAIKELNQ